MSESDPIKVLLIEDDDRLARLTAKYLESHGLVVTVSPDGRGGLAEALRSPPDVVLLDLMLPGMSGMEVCRELREKSDVPIVMVTALGEEADKVLGLEGGADDYLPKPFSSRELLARVRAQSRRARGRSGPGAERLKVGPLAIDAGSHSARLDGKLLPLTSAEFALLAALARRPGRVLSRDQLIELTKGSADEAFDRSIDVSISRLRQKLGDDPKNPRFLKTVRGVGYLLADGDP
ncbi:MAG TPA: response regulator transcription factor [Myxococcaceae bacterium]|nr:response regulator transcription factor [Myxococcaceae bacterium]